MLGCDPTDGLFVQCGVPSAAWQSPTHVDARGGLGLSCGVRCAVGVSTGDDEAINPALGDEPRWCGLGLLLGEIFD